MLSWVRRLQRSCERKIPCSLSTHYIPTKTGVPSLNTAAHSLNQNSPAERAKNHRIERDPCSFRKRLRHRQCSVLDLQSRADVDSDQAHVPRTQRALEVRGLFSPSFFLSSDLNFCSSFYPLRTCLKIVERLCRVNKSLSLACFCRFAVSISLFSMIIFFCYISVCVVHYELLRQEKGKDINLLALSFQVLWLFWDWKLLELKRHRTAFYKGLYW